MKIKNPPKFFDRLDEDVRLVKRKLNRCYCLFTEEENSQILESITSLENLISEAKSRTLPK